MPDEPQEAPKRPFYRRLWPTTIAGKAALVTTLVLTLILVAVWLLRFFGPDSVRVLHAVSNTQVVIEILLVILIPIVLYWGIRRWNQVIEGDYPDIDLAWKAGVAALKAKGVSISDYPVFLVLGSPDDHVEFGLMSALDSDLAICGVPEGDGVSHALRWFMSEDAIYLFCPHASCLSELVRRWKPSLQPGQRQVQRIRTMSSAAETTTGAAQPTAVDSQMELPRIERPATAKTPVPSPAGQEKSAVLTKQSRMPAAAPNAPGQSGLSASGSPSSGGGQGGSESYMGTIGSFNMPAASASPPGFSPPAASAPSASAPSVSAPSVSAPAFAPPSISASGVTPPSVSAPSASAPSASAPSVTPPSASSAPFNMPPANPPASAAAGGDALRPAPKFEGTIMFDQYSSEQAVKPEPPAAAAPVARPQTAQRPPAQPTAAQPPAAQRPATPAPAVASPAAQPATAPQRSAPLASRATSGKQKEIALPSNLDTTNQIPRLKYVCRLLQRSRRPRCGVNGLVTLLPYEMHQVNPLQLSAIAQSARNDVATIEKTLQLRIPVTAMLIGMANDKGFTELVRRLQSTLLSRRLGGRFDLRSRPTPDELNSHSDRLCDAFEDWVYHLFGREEGLSQQRGNRKLYALTCKIRHELKPRLRMVLGKAFGCDASADATNASGEDGFFFSGCYFAASGGSDGDAAFVKGVLQDKLLDEQSQVQWTEAAKQRHTAFRTLSVIGWLIAICLAIAVLIMLPQ